MHLKHLPPNLPLPSPAVSGAALKREVAARIAAIRSEDLPKDLRIRENKRKFLISI